MSKSLFEKKAAAVPSLTWCEGNGCQNLVLFTAPFVQYFCTKECECRTLDEDAQEMRVMDDLAHREELALQEWKDKMSDWGSYE